MDTQFSPQLVKIGIVHPGRMGSTLAYALKRSGHEVYWVSEGRSEQTKERAAEFGLVDLKNLEALLTECNVVISIINGGWCQEFAEHVSRRGYDGIFVDANGLWGESAEQLFAHIFSESGIDYVEAGLYGWPYPGREGFTDEHTMYLSGEKAGFIASLFSDGYWDIQLCETSAKEVKRLRNLSESDGASKETE
jgi:3-hydroxyisobutyrate dehydrogenase-like beta-hydroxyacid dehydrogenase